MILYVLYSDQIPFRFDIFWVPNLQVCITSMFQNLGSEHLNHYWVVGM